MVVEGIGDSGEAEDANRMAEVWRKTCAGESHLCKSFLHSPKPVHNSNMVLSTVKSGPPFMLNS